MWKVRERARDESKGKREVERRLGLVQHVGRVIGIAL